jgi:hypothetical protein
MWLACWQGADCPRQALLPLGVFLFQGRWYLLANPPLFFVFWFCRHTASAPGNYIRNAHRWRCSNRVARKRPARRHSRKGLRLEAFILPGHARTGIISTNQELTQGLPFNFLTDIYPGVGCWDSEKGTTLPYKNCFVPQTPFLVQVLVNFGGIFFGGKIKGT